MPNRVSQTNLIGAAGEYYVAAELSRAGWLATVTIKNSPGLDVLAVEPPPGDKSVAIQVKTTTKGHWVLPTPRPDGERRPDEFFVLVQIRGDQERPDFFVVPAELMDRVVSWHRNEFVIRRGRSPSMNTIRPSWIAQFREAWNVLRDASGAEELLESNYRSS
jgi:hypothetical protein